MPSIKPESTKSKLTKSELVKSELVNFFQDYAQRPIVIAYSGGIDSQVLLHALATIKQNNQLSNHLSVCHIDHGLSKSAKSWQQFAIQQCQKLAMPLIIQEVKVEALPQKSLEALAREARYQALKTTAPNNALIVTGHHGDDQAETFLLALKRGSGLKGLSAMAKVSRLTSLSEEQCLVRPLIKFTRKDIEDYAKQHNLTWVEDESNQDEVFDRNFIRHQIMPLLTKRWPRFLKTINRSAGHCSEAQLLLTDLAQLDLNECQMTLDSLSVVKLKQLSKARFNNLLRHFIETKQALMPTTEQLDQVYLQLFAQADKCPAIKVADHWFRRFQEQLYLTVDFKDVSSWKNTFTEEDISQSKFGYIFDLPDKLGQITVVRQINKENKIQRDNKAQYEIKAPAYNQKITIRFNHNNPKCLPDYRQHSRPLKKVLQELAISPWQRKRLAFLYYDEILVAVLGHFICKSYLADALTPSLTIFWRDK